MLQESGVLNKALLNLKLLKIRATTTSVSPALFSTPVYLVTTYASQAGRLELLSDSTLVVMQLSLARLSLVPTNASLVYTATSLSLSPLSRLPLACYYACLSRVYICGGERGRC